MTNLSTEEKIDYIYETLKGQKRRQFLGDFLRWGWRLFIIGNLIYFYYFGAQIIESRVKSILSSATPDMSINSLVGSGTLDTIKDFMNKKQSTNEF